jgi:hypothetical protein
MTFFENVYENVNIERARAEVAGQGWALLGTPLDTSVSAQMCGEIDVLAEADDTEVNYGGSEHRIWHAQAKSALINQFCIFSDKILSEVMGAPKRAHNILAIRNRTLDSEAATLHEGRWHLDSFNQQMKIFVFLTDVTQASGVFEMIPGTHAMPFKMRKALQGHFFAPKDLVHGTRSYAQLKDTLIKSIVAKGYETKAFDVPAGTIALVDTSCVHRARPCTMGERYALTSYY